MSVTITFTFVDEENASLSIDSVVLGSQSDQDVSSKVFTVDEFSEYDLSVTKSGYASYVNKIFVYDANISITITLVDVNHPDIVNKYKVVPNQEWDTGKFAGYDIYLTASTQIARYHIFERKSGELIEGTYIDGIIGNKRFTFMPMSDGVNNMQYRSDETSAIGVNLTTSRSPINFNMDVDFEVVELCSKLNVEDNTDYINQSAWHLYGLNKGMRGLFIIYNNQVFLYTSETYAELITDSNYANAQYNIVQNRFEFFGSFIIYVYPGALSSLNVSGASGANDFQITLPFTHGVFYALYAFVPLAQNGVTYNPGDVVCTIFPPNMSRVNYKHIGSSPSIFDSTDTANWETVNLIINTYPIFDIDLHEYYNPGVQERHDWLEANCQFPDIQINSYNACPHIVSLILVTTKRGQTIVATHVTVKDFLTEEIIHEELISIVNSEQYTYLYNPGYDSLFLIEVTVTLSDNSSYSYSAVSAYLCNTMNCILGNLSCDKCKDKCDEKTVRANLVSVFSEKILEESRKSEIDSVLLIELFSKIKKLCSSC